MLIDLTESKIEQRVKMYKQSRRTSFCAYMYDMGALRKHVQKLIGSVPENCEIFYAVKANSEHKIIQELSHYVHGFEVASFGEIEKVRAVNQTVPIIFGGPGKTDEEMQGAIKHNVKLFHVESIHEMNRLNYIAQQLEKSVSILLRVNLQSVIADARLKMAGTPTQFGIEEAEIPRVLQMLERYPSLTLEGFHFHAMSNNLNASKHARFVRYCVEKVREWEKMFQLEVSYVNAGGGIGINYTETDQQFNWDLFTVELSQEFNKNGAPYKVLFELGRYIAASSGYYATEIIDIKQNHGKTFAIIRGGTHHLRLPAAWKMNHPFTVIPVNEWPYPFERPQLEGEAVTIAGELCTPNDILARDVLIKQLRAGDVLLFQYAGAYGWDISHHDFLSHPHPELLFLE